MMPHPQKNANFDWAYIYYVGRKVLELDEDEFWDSSMEKINELVEVHGAMNDKKLLKQRNRKMAKHKADSIGNVYIDQVSFL